VKKRPTKKLALSRETLQNLATEQIKLAGAGDSILICDPPPTSDSVRYCCADE